MLEVAIAVLCLLILVRAMDGRRLSIVVEPLEDTLRSPEPVHDDWYQDEHFQGDHGRVQ